MFNRIRNYFYERRRTLWTAAGVAGAFYMAGKYVSERLDDMREQSAQLQKARENLRRRFEQNQEDVMFTIMAHLPTLGKAVMDGMDVETVTQELQARSHLGRARAHSPNPPPSESSLTSSVEFVQPSAPVTSGSHAESPTGTDTSITVDSSGLSGLEGSQMSTVSASTQAQSWVHDFGSQTAGSSTSQGPALELPAPSSHHRQESTLASPLSNTGTGMSDSMMSESLMSTSASASERGHSHAKQSENSEREGSTLSLKSKAELWRETKILTFTRTLTIIYSTTLLSLLTTMQLNIIGRSKYLQSIVQLHREEKLREYRTYRASISSLFFGGFLGPDDDLERWIDADVQDTENVSSDTERKFLTISWWLLYVGWKDVGERVRRSVEEVFESVSLKARLGPLGLHRLLLDVRRRVEHEITYEGTERRINFLSTLIPPTPETLALAFGEGGVPGYRPSSSQPSSSSPFIPHSQLPSSSSTSLPPDPESDPAFARLFTELRITASSPAFVAVLEAALDRATDVLLDGLRKNVFHCMDDNVERLGRNMDTELEKPRLANLLPGLARWSQLALNTVPNELVDSIMGLKETTTFSAIIYSSYDERLH